MKTWIWQFLESLWLALPYLALGAFTHGKNAGVKLDNGAGALTDITAYTDKASMDRLRELAETTVFGNNDKTFLPGLRESSFSLSGKFDPAIDQILHDDYTDNANTKTIEYGPEGTGSGKVKYSVEVWVKSYKIDAGLGESVPWNAERHGHGDARHLRVTRATDSTSTTSATSHTEAA
jgi:hypothetical protein